MDQALSILPADYWRWWLLSHAPENSDSEFTWENFQTSVNKDLADVLGNFVSRITKFCRSKFGEAVPEGGAYGPEESALITRLTEGLRAYEDHMAGDGNPQGGDRTSRALGAGNEYLQAAAPWTVHKTDPDRAAAITRLSLNLIRLYAVISAALHPRCLRRADGRDADRRRPPGPTTWPQALAALPRRTRLHRARSDLPQDHRRGTRRLADTVFRRAQLTRGFHYLSANIPAGGTATQAQPAAQTLCRRRQASSLPPRK